MSKKKAVVFRHMHQESFGSLEEVLWGRDFEFEYFNTARGNFDDIDPLEPDFLAIGCWHCFSVPTTRHVLDECALGTYRLDNRPDLRCASGCV